MFFPVEKVNEKFRLQGPVVVGWGDCRTCSLLTDIPICDYSWCILVSEEDEDSWEKKPCCWDCERLLDCVDEFIGMDPEYLKEVLKVGEKELKEAIIKLRDRLKRTK